MEPRFGGAPSGLFCACLTIDKYMKILYQIDVKLTFDI